MRSPPLPSLLYVVGILLGVGSVVLRVTHHISLGLCVALFTVALVVMRTARRLRKTASRS